MNVYHVHGAVAAEIRKWESYNLDAAQKLVRCTVFASYITCEEGWDRYFNRTQLPKKEIEYLCYFKEHSQALYMLMM